MNITKKRLASMDRPYAVAATNMGGRVAVFAASEERNGEALMFCGVNWASSKIACEPGGCMGIIPMNISGSPAVLMIEEFFPIFQSASAGVAIYCPNPDSAQTWLRHRVFDLSYLHRMVMVTANGLPTIVAASLCGKKDYRDDWSSPGAVYSIRAKQDDFSWRVDEQPILDGLTKNHGMYVKRHGQSETIFVSGDEGIFAIEVPLADEPWKTERILDVPTSDLVVADMDGDGKDEILTIEPFHGDTAHIYKQRNDTWCTVWEEQISFGHVVWAGQIRGRISIILCSRSGKKDLCLYMLEDPSTWKFTKTTIDEGGEPMNIAVVNENGRDLIFATNGGIGEVALYEIT